MSPASRNALALRSAQLRQSAHGTTVKFRQAEIRVCLAPVSIGLDLETGGLRQGGEFSIRFLAADLQSPPRRGEAVSFGAKTYFLSQISETHAPGEYLATMSPGGAA